MDFESPKIYEPIPSLPELKDRLLMYMESYNEAVRGANMDLVFFKDAMVHLVKVKQSSHFFNILSMQHYTNTGDRGFDGYVCVLID